MYFRHIRWVTLGLVLYGGAAIAVMYFFRTVHKVNQTRQAQITILQKSDYIVASNSSTLKYYYEPEPNYIQVRKPVFLDHEVTNTINADGLNDRTDYSADKPIGTYRIVTIGDSFTFGMYVKTQESYPEVLEDLLNKHLQCQNISHFDVINLGVPGYDIAYAVERLRRRGLKYDPDLVIWHLNTVTFMYILDMLFASKERYVQQGFVDDQKTQSSPALGKAYEDQYKLTDSFRKTQHLGVLASIRSFYTHPLLFTSFPSLEGKYKATLQAFLNDDKNSFYFNALTDIQLDDRLHLKGDFHPSPEGHRTMASDILSYLLENILTSCTRI